MGNKNDEVPFPAYIKWNKLNAGSNKEVKALHL